MRTLVFTLAAAAALAACDQADHTIVAAGPGDPNAPEVNTAGVVLPAAIAASKAYRCTDNSLVYIDWLSDGSARAKPGPNAIGEPVVLGEELKGAQADASITYKGKTCRA